jgi:hypothetical protein
MTGCLLALIASMALSMVEACGGGSSGEGSADAGTEGADATAEGQDGSASDAGHVADARGLDGGSPRDSDAVDGAGSGTLTGSQAFTVAWALMDPSEPADECMSDAVPGGGVAATAILLAQEDLSSSVCGDGGNPDAGVGYIVNIEIATQEYAMGTTQLTQSLTAGTYVIGNEGEDDEDLCMLPGGSTAILQLFDPTNPGGASSIAISGTVTIDSVGPGSIAGSFDAVMGGPYGYTDASPPPSLSGTFKAPVCP